MSKKQDVARSRNWTKARLLSFNFKTVFTKEERDLMDKLNMIRGELLNNWNKRTKEILLLTKNV